MRSQLLSSKARTVVQTNDLKVVDAETKATKKERLVRVM
jgi:hypothetical protein